MFQDEGSKVMKNFNCVLYKLILKWIFVESVHGANSQFHRSNRVSGLIDGAFKIRFFYQQVEKENHIENEKFPQNSQNLEGEP